MRAWMGLGALALALAGVMAVLLALSRLPGSETLFPWPVAFFERGLVAHVVFSFVVWFLAAFGLLLVLANSRLSKTALDRIALGGVSVSIVLLLIPSFSNRGEPTLNNYIPAIADPLYYAGLALLAGALLLPVVRFLAGLARGQIPGTPFALMLAAGGAIYILALAAFARSAAALWPATPSYDFNEALFWGGGHILQFLNVAILIAAWIALAEKILGSETVEKPAFRLAALLLLLGALAGFAIDLALDVRAPARREAFALLQYALAPAPLLAAGALARSLMPAWAARPDLRRHPALLALALSVAVFAVGGFLGLFVDGADTRTPAHYHGVIGGINLALMGVFLAVALPAAGRAPRARRLLALQIWLYGAGQAIASLGLFWAGGYGAPRKAPASEAQGLVELGAKLGLYLNGFGALIAVMGGVLFIVTVAGALLRRERNV
ncbi:MAG: cbb3-type cytochrome c oxidase subunit I [Pseudomonadota bacterium]